MTTASLESVQQLRDKVESLNLQAEQNHLESVLKGQAESARLLEDWGDFVDPLDSLRSEPELFGGAVAGARGEMPGDRRHGDYAPHFISEQQIRLIRGACGWLADTDVTIIGAFETLTAFVLKQGSTCEVVANNDEGATWTDPVKDAIDEFTSRVNWYGGIDEESLQRTRKAGTRFMRITDCGDGYAGVEFYEPSWITAPQNKDSIAQHYGLPLDLDWKYGVITDPDNVSLLWGFYAAKNGDPKCGEFIPLSEMDRMKVNTDSNAKLGLPDLYAGRKWATKCEKLLERVLDGAAIQASIALRRSYPPGTPNTKIDSAADGQVTFRRSTPTLGGSTTTRVQQFRSGEIIDEKGVVTSAGAMGEGHGESFIAVLQGGLRALSRRWGFTEDSISGDASNNNRASLAEAGSTSLTRMQKAQINIAANDVGIFWRVVDRAIQGGRIIGKSLDELKALVTIKVTPADIEHRERKEESDIRKDEHDAGLLSLHTWAAETNRDYDEEQQKRATEPQPAPAAPFGVQLHGLPGAGGNLVPNKPAIPDAPASPYTESRVESLAARALKLLTESK